MFARALSSCNIKDLISNVGSSAAVPAAAAGTGAAPAEEAKKEDKKEEEKKEETDSDDEDMGLGKSVMCPYIMVDCYNECGHLYLCHEFLGD